MRCAAHQTEYQTSLTRTIIIIFDQNTEKNYHLIESIEYRTQTNRNPFDLNEKFGKENREKIE